MYKRQFQRFAPSARERLVCARFHVAQPLSAGLVASAIEEVVNARDANVPQTEDAPLDVAAPSEVATRASACRSAIAARGGIADRRPGQPPQP